MNRAAPLLALVLSLFLLYAAADDSPVPAAAKRYGPSLVRVSYLESFRDSDGSIRTREVEALGVCTAEGRVLIRGHADAGDVPPSRFSVILPDGSTVPARYLGKDPALNVCVLEPASPIPGIPFGDAGRPKLGERLLVMFRQGREADYALEVSHAWVASVLPGDPPALVLDGVGIYGKAGAAVFDLSGRPLGVVGFDLSPAEGGPPGCRPGVPLLYPGRALASLKPVARKDGRAVAEGWSGALFGEVSRELAARLGISGGAALVTLVVPGSPAAVAGLAPLDVVTALGGVPLPARGRAADELVRRIRKLGAGRKTALTVLRDGKRMEIFLTLAPLPPDGNTVERLELETFGLTVRQITWDFYVYRNLPWDLRGVVVDRVVSGSPAGVAGLAGGDVITAVGGGPVSSPEELQAALEKAGGGPLLLAVRRGARRLFMKLETFGGE